MSDWQWTKPRPYDWSKDAHFLEDVANHHTPTRGLSFYGNDGGRLSRMGPHGNNMVDRWLCYLALVGKGVRS